MRHSKIPNHVTAEAPKLRPKTKEKMGSEKISIQPLLSPALMEFVLNKPLVPRLILDADRVVLRDHTDSTILRFDRLPRGSTKMKRHPRSLFIPGDASDRWADVAFVTHYVGAMWSSAGHPA